MTAPVVCGMQVSSSFLYCCPGSHTVWPRCEGLILKTPGPGCRLPQLQSATRSSVYVVLVTGPVFAFAIGIISFSKSRTSFQSCRRLSVPRKSEPPARKMALQWKQHLCRRSMICQQENTFLNNIDTLLKNPALYIINS